MTVFLADKSQTVFNVGLMYSVLVDSFSYGSNKVTYSFEKPELDSLRIDGISTSTNVRNAFG